MKKGILVISLFVVLSGVITLINSCVKKDNQIRLEFSVDSIKQNVYVGDTGYTHWPLKISFLNGNAQEKVTVKINNLPLRLTVTPDSITGTPTFYQDFVFYGNYVIHGSYPVSLTASSPSAGVKTYNFNLVVFTADCANGMDGTYNASNECFIAPTTYTCNITHFATDSLKIANFGGYGLGTSVKVKLKCNLDSCFIAKQANGNGDTIQGLGKFTQTSLTIYYKKTNVFGVSDSCTATINKQ